MKKQVTKSQSGEPTYVHTLLEWYQNVRSLKKPWFFDQIENIRKILGK